MSFKQQLISMLPGPSAYIRLKEFISKPGSKGFYLVDMNRIFELLTKTQTSFVQIGANDGQLNDPIYPFIKSGKWKGVLVEPFPPLFEKLKKTYAGQTGLVFENVGISDQDGQLLYYYLPPECNEPDWLQQIGTFDRKAIELNLAELPRFLPMIESLPISTITLKRLFERNGIREIDVLIVDAEGFEWRILRQLEHTEVRPGYILFEWGCLSEEEYRKLVTFLESLKYKIYQSGGDLLAVFNKS